MGIFSYNNCVYPSCLLGWKFNQYNLSFIELIIKIIMNRPRMRVLRVHPISALDNYDPHGHLVGWEAFDSARGEDTFKQLRVNLSKYEKKYNDLKKA